MLMLLLEGTPLPSPDVHVDLRPVGADMHFCYVVGDKQQRLCLCICVYFYVFVPCLTLLCNTTPHPPHPSTTPPKFHFSYWMQNFADMQLFRSVPLLLLNLLLAFYRNCSQGLFFLLLSFVVDNIVHIADVC